MKTIQVNAMGESCPIPIVMTKNAVKELGEAGGKIETAVDNEIAVQNLLKMGRIKGYECSFQQISQDEYLVEMLVGGGN